MPTAACSKVASNKWPGPPSGTAYSAVQPGTADDGARSLGSIIGDAGNMRPRLAWTHATLCKRRLILHRVRGGDRTSFVAGANLHASSSNSLSRGTRQAVTPTTPSVTTPPKITERTVPSNFAATPDS